jgi:hypothetical protein
MNGLVFWHSPKGGQWAVGSHQSAVGRFSPFASLSVNAQCSMLNESIVFLAFAKGGSVGSGQSSFGRFSPFASLSVNARCSMLNAE